MKKLLYFALILSFTTPCYADHNLEHNSAVVVNKDIDGLDVLADIPLRITGFIATVLGTGLFVGIAPITSLMTTIPPHDAMNKVADFLILQPAHYTFDRPVGDFNFNSRFDKKNQEFRNPRKN